MSDMVFVWAIGATVTWGFCLAFTHEKDGKKIGFGFGVFFAIACLYLWPLIIGTELGAALGKLNKEGRG